MLIRTDRDMVTICKEGGEVLICTDSGELQELVFLSDKPGEYIYVEDGGRKFDGNEWYLQYDWIEARLFHDASGQCHLRIIAGYNGTGKTRGCQINIAGSGNVTGVKVWQE